MQFTEYLTPITEHLFLKSRNMRPIIAVSVDHRYNSLPRTTEGRAADQLSTSQPSATQSPHCLVADKILNTALP